eukprot:8759034-Prorocentrum_lima.AAC.1
MCKDTLRHHSQSEPGSVYTKIQIVRAYTVRGSGVTKATFSNNMLDGIHALARLDDAMNGF